MATFCVSTLLFALTNAATKPNFIFILTDDQDITLDSMQAMPFTHKYLIEEGLTFNNTFISTPICCPSRTETISGRHFQNVRLEKGGCMHADATGNVFNNTNSMFQIFKKNGYLTGSFGKLTNNMNGFWCNDDPMIQGFDRINCPCDYNNFYGTKYFQKYNNGTMENYTLPVTPTLYETSQIGNASMEWLKDRLTDTDANKSPFIMWIGPHAPHYPATPAAWYADKYNDAKAPITPNYNESDKNKHGFVGTNPFITENASWWIDQLYRDRLRSLLSVDDLVKDIVELLNQYPTEMDNTYILYTSDHGYHLGQYDVPCSKQQPYEETIRIPMYFKGPNVPKNKTTMDIVGNIDILPTFLSLAGITYDKDTYDGRSWTTGLLNGVEVGNLITTDVSSADEWRTVYLSQYQSVGTYGFSHCSTWFPASDGSVCPGQNHHPPENSSVTGTPWLVDNTEENNWRAVRIINATVDMVYIETVDPTWNETAFENPQFHEYYDLKTDPFQLKNAYDSLNGDIKTELHELLMKYGNCTGSACW